MPASKMEVAMTQTATFSIGSSELGLTRYLEEVRGFPMLQRQEEYNLAKRWREHDDRNAAHKLVRFRRSFPRAIWD
jgi:RNA polymerase sigma-32 factor